MQHRVPLTVVNVRMHEKEINVYTWPSAASQRSKKSGDHYSLGYWVLIQVEPSINVIYTLDFSEIIRQYPRLPAMY